VFPVSCNELFGVVNDELLFAHGVDWAVGKLLTGEVKPKFSD